MSKNLKSGLDVSRNSVKISVVLNGIKLTGNVQREALGKVIYTVASGAVTSREVVAASPALILFYESTVKKNPALANWQVNLDVQRVTLGSDTKIIRWYQDYTQSWKLGTLYQIAKIAVVIGNSIKAYDKLELPKQVVRSEAPGKEARATKATKVKQTVDFSDITL